MIPWQRSRVREIVTRLFLNQKQWKSSELEKAAYNWHISNGGMEIDNPRYTLKRALKDLKEDNNIVSVGRGYFMWNDTFDQSNDSKNDGVNPALQLNPISAEAGIERAEIEPVMVPELEIGEGSECVYVYYSPNDRRLAETEKRKTWECKVGCTTETHVSRRILCQGISTAISRLPTIGLVIRTDDSSLLEKVLHYSLRMKGADYEESVGKEWFITNPDHIKKWYQYFLHSLSELDGREQELGQ